MAKTKSGRSTEQVNIDFLAKLSNLTLSKEEGPLYQSQLKEILGYIKQLEKASSLGVESTFNVSQNSSITRGDIPKTSLSQKEALANSPKTQGGCFVTKGVFENE